MQASTRPAKAGASPRSAGPPSAPDAASSRVRVPGIHAGRGGRSHRKADVHAGALPPTLPRRLGHLCAAAARVRRRQVPLREAPAPGLTHASVTELRACALQASREAFAPAGPENLKVRREPAGMQTGLAWGPWRPSKQHSSTQELGL